MNGDSQHLGVRRWNEPPARADQHAPVEPSDAASAAADGGSDVPEPASVAPGVAFSLFDEAGEDEALLWALRESEADDEREETAAPPPGNGRTSEPVSPLSATSLIPPPRGHVAHEDVSPTLERREMVKGGQLGDTYVRVRSPERGYFARKAFDELEARVPAPAPRTGTERLLRRARITLFGPPLTTAQQIHERLTKVKALAVLSSDAISSVAYATEASLAILITAGLGVMRFNPWIACAIVTLMVIVGASYYQTIHAYPQGGGSYIVARANLGDWPGLVAAAALLIDYVLTVSVSVSAGVDAIVSLDTASLRVFSVPLGVVFILAIMVVNLRGVRESGTIFAAPTYLFIGAFLVMICTGVAHAALAPGGLFTPLPPHVAPFGPPLGWAPEKLTVLLALTAFASGCSAMTGVEAISNGVPAFQAPESKNAARTLLWMVGILVTLYLGTTYLAWRFGIEPYNGGQPTVTSQLAKLLFGGAYTTWFYYVIQLATMLILILAANTSYADFPRLASILARDGWLPKGFSFRGNRLAFSTGIVALTILATALMVMFSGNTEALINLYALGVFTAFTLSQGGMVMHWWRLRAQPGSGWRRSMVINGIGGATTGLVALVIMVTKFDRGAWIVVLLVPLLVMMFRRIARHYRSVSQQIRQLEALPTTAVRHQALAPISRMDRVAERTLTYARSLGLQVTAVHVTTEQEDDSDFREAFYRWVHDMEQAERSQATGAAPSPPPQLVVIRSPYRGLVGPFVEYVRQRQRAAPGSLVTVFLPEYVPARFWERVLHNETALRLKLALYAMRGVVVTNVPYHLGRGSEPQPEVELSRPR
ncbi:MAG TPA: APC family permease [Ktedonobacterales bacterium]